MKNRFTKTGNIRNLCVFALLTALPLAGIAQTSHMVDVTNNKFTPAEITVNEGDTVIWTNSEGRHNVNGTTAKYPDNPESFGNEVATDWTFSHIFTMVGTYKYQCDPHVQSAMFGTVIVQDFATAIKSQDKFESEITLYPNPAYDEISVTSLENIKSISIIDVRGSNIRYYGNMRGNKQVISLDGINAGIYFLEVKSNEGLKELKSFVKR